MLTTVLIKNLAVIREMELQLNGGLTVLSGETGAGKSILIDALQAILGARVSKDIIRQDAKSALVEAAFCFLEDTAPKTLQPYLSDDMLVISREIFRDGRNVVKLNSQLSNTAQLRALAPYLISIHSQNDNQILFQRELHFRFLDQFAKCEDLYQSYREAYERYCHLTQQEQELCDGQQQDAGRAEYLKYVLSEIENANIQPDEEETLKAIKASMKNKEKNDRNIQIATCALYENQESAYHFVSVAEEALKGMDAFFDVAQRLGELKYEIAELSDRVRTFRHEVESEYQNLDEVEQRLDLIYRLKMKYGKTVDAMLSFYEKSAQELYDLEHKDSRMEEIRRQKKECEGAITALLPGLTAKRFQAAQLLAEALERELKDLMMPNARFEIRLTKTEPFGAHGGEEVEFLFSANSGMEPQPLHKIASGGEISRVNLALKSVLRGIDPACAFVFDEIDTGLSGRAAQKTGEKMYAIGQDSQVLCVTHLPQIAAMADWQILVSKEETKGETITTVTPVEGLARVEEIARMIGGAEMTDLTLKNAAEILELAKKQKTEC